MHMYVFNGLRDGIGRADICVAVSRCVYTSKEKLMQLENKHFLLVRKTSPFARMTVYFAGAKNVNGQTQILWTPVRGLSAEIPSVHLAEEWQRILAEFGPDHEVWAEPVPPRALPSYRLPLRSTVHTPKHEAKIPFVECDALTPHGWQRTSGRPVEQGTDSTWGRVRRFLTAPR